MRTLSWRSAAAGAALLVAMACGSSSVSVERSAASATPDAATRAYIALVRAYWADLHAADVASVGSDVDAKACLGEMSPSSPRDVHVVEPQICRAYAVATLAANEKFLANLETLYAPPKFASDDRAFRANVTKANSDLKALIAACDGPNPQAIIDTMWAYAGDMMPDVTNALDDVDPSVAHLDPSAKTG